MYHSICSDASYKSDPSSVPQGLRGSWRRTLEMEQLSLCELC